jgi:cytochrome oxidase assembly protein ShyY1
VLSQILNVIKQQWKLTTLVLLFLPILINLGLWQLERAEQKEKLLDFYEQQSELKHTPLANLDSTDKTKYKNVIVSGKYDIDYYWLLDNQPRQGGPGYEIIMPFNFQNKNGDKHTLLVNRGWIKAEADRTKLPLIETPSEEVTIKGYLYPLQVNAVIQHSQNDLDVEWPKRVLQLDNKSAAEALSKNIDIMMLRIDEDSIGAYITYWPVINTQPQKHHGYAVQWFAMSFALILLYAWFIFKEIKIKTKK